MILTRVGSPSPRKNLLKTSVCSPACFEGNFSSCITASPIPNIYSDMRIISPGLENVNKLVTKRLDTVARYRVYTMYWTEVAELRDFTVGQLVVPRQRV